MSVKASVASMALSGCPEAGALRCRPELADRNLDAPQLQKLEEIVERAEEASLVQIGAYLTDAWTIQQESLVERGPWAGRTRTIFQQFENGVDDRRGHVGNLVYKAGTNREKDHFSWARRDAPNTIPVGTGVLNLENKTLFWPEIGRTGRVLLCRFNGVPDDRRAAGAEEMSVLEQDMWTWLEGGEVLAMGASDTFNEVYVAVRHSDTQGLRVNVTKAYEFDLSAPAVSADGRQGYTKVRQVHYHVNDVNGEKTFRKLEDGH